MLEGLYSAAAGMAAQQQRMDALSNDVANVNTTGYKHLRVGFRDLLYAPVSPGAAAGVSSGTGATAWIAGREQAPGPLQATDRPLDLALTGPGFFEVRRPDGMLALTRAGALTLDAGGRLRTVSGELVVGPGPLPRATSPDRIRVAPDGTVSVAGRGFGRIAVVDVAAPDGLLALGDNLFAPSPASGPPRPSRSAIQQRALEGSNVDLADAMVDMMDAQRSYQLASSAIRTQDQLLEIANGVKR